MEPHPGTFNRIGHQRLEEDLVRRTGEDVLSVGTSIPDVKER